MLRRVRLYRGEAVQAVTGSTIIAACMMILAGVSASAAHAATGGAVPSKQPPLGPLVGSPSAATQPRALPAGSALLPGFEAFTLPGNDDGSTAEIKLPFPIKFFTKTYKALYINNNGNVTFGAATSQFTPEPLWKLKTPMIAPFWADVDTRVGNVVTYGTGTVDGHQAFGVTWPGVGCYSEIDSVTNTFQLVLINRSDVGKGDFDTEFNYGPIEWDSGQASGGDASCLHGTAAAAGYTSGTGSSYELPGSGTDGALLSSNPVTGLSNQSYGSTQPGVDVYQVRGGQPTPSASSAYVALGDSYASGLGSFSYLKGTTSGKNPCYRATDGYVEQIATNQNDSLDFAACSGATISNLVVGSSAQILQIGAGTRLVTLSIGGNDVGFADVLASCISGEHSPGSSGCASRDQSAATNALGWLESGREPGCYTLPGIDPQSGAPVQSCNSQRLPSLTELYEQIATAAPGAHVVVVGYPELFETSVFPVTDCQVGTAAGVFSYTISAPDIEWIDRETNALDQIIESGVQSAATATGANITFVDPRESFAGGGLCDTGIEYINGLLFKGKVSIHPTKWFKLENESFHPNVTGQEILANQIESQLP